MGDRLTQLQDAVDQLALQMLSSYYYVNKHHDADKLGPGDDVREKKPEDTEVEPYPAEQFEAGQIELARDMVLKEQQIEYLISILPGLDNSERDQERYIKELEDELKVAEAQRLDAIREKDEVLAKLDGVIRSVERPR